MPPIRIALIGLSQSAKTSWASQGHLPYLLSERGRERYKIVALLNSSEEAAKNAIKAYELSGDVKAYGSPQALAEDADIDLVVCTTRVDVHYDTIKPSVAAGKAVFAEWPLAENAVRAKELADLAKQSGSRTLIGLQARGMPAVLKVKEIIQSGEIGKVLSSNVQAFTPNGGGDDISEGLGYFLDKKIGGNPVTIAVGHMIDLVHTVLGEYSSSHSHLQIQRPNQKIVNRETGAEKSTQSDVPDLVSIHGTLVPSSHVVDGASLIVNFASGRPFPGTVPFIWTITGEKGRIRMSCERGPYIQADGGTFPIPVEVENFATGEFKQVSWSWDSWQEPLLPRGRSIAKAYDLWYEGRAKEYGLADFSDAVVRHEQLDAMLY